MKTFYLKKDPNQNSEIGDVSKLILENSVELKNEKALHEPDSSIEAEDFVTCYMKTIFF